MTLFILLYWTFISGNRRYYLISGKTNRFYYWNFINNEKIVITVSHDNLKEIQQMAAKYIGSSTNIFETRFEKLNCLIILKINRDCIKK